MKKKLLALLLCIACGFAFVPQTVAMAQEDAVVTTPQFTIPDTGELSAYCGADGNIDFYLSVEDGFNDQIVRIVFFEKDTKKEYFYKFDPANYDDPGLWVQRINIPQGNYFVSCRVSNDVAGSAKCQLVTGNPMAVGPMLESYVCLVGSYDWIDANMEAFTQEPEPTAVPEVTEPVNSEEEVISTQEPLQEIPPVVVETPEEEPEESKSPATAIAIGIVVIVGALLLLKKKKK